MGVGIEPVGTGSSSVLGLPYTYLWETQRSASSPPQLRAREALRSEVGNMVFFTGHTLKDIVEGIIVPCRLSFSGAVNYFGCSFIKLCDLPPTRAR